MTDEYQKEVLLRPAVEFYAATVAFVSGVLCIWTPGFLMIPEAVGLFAGVLAFAIAIYDSQRGYRILKYRRGMNRVRPFVVETKKIPIHDDCLYIGHGFEWKQKHTQRYLDTFDRKYIPFVKRDEHKIARAVEKTLDPIPVVNFVSRFLRQTWVINPCLLYTSPSPRDRG